MVKCPARNEMLAPRIENQNNQFTKVILFTKVPFDITTKEDRSYPNLLYAGMFGIC